MYIMYFGKIPHINWKSILLFPGWSNTFILTWFWYFEISQAPYCQYIERALSHHSCPIMLSARMPRIENKNSNEGKAWKFCTSDTKNGKCLKSSCKKSILKAMKQVGKRNRKGTGVADNHVAPLYFLHVCTVGRADRR